MRSNKLNLRDRLEGTELDLSMSEIEEVPVREIVSLNWEQFRHCIIIYFFLFHLPFIHYKQHNLPSIKVCFLEFHVYTTPFFSSCVKHRSQVAFCSGCLEFESWFRDWLSWLRFFWFSLALPDKFPDGTSNYATTLFHVTFNLFFH
jgi:hypothetical protein